MSHEITLREAGRATGGVFRRRYELRLAMPSDSTEVVTFDLRGRDDVALAQEGDTVTVVWSLRGDREEELVYVMNRTSGRVLQVDPPGTMARQRGYAAAAMVFAAVFVLTCAGTGGQLGLPFLTAVLVAAGAGVAVSRLSRPTHDLPADARAALSAAQSLLAQRGELARARTEAEADFRRKETAVAELRTLAARMRATDPSLYADRVVAIDRGIVSIEHQLAVERQLIDAHSRVIGILEIEAETARASLTIERDASASIDQLIDEVRQLRESTEELERQLRTNDEVERYLRRVRP